jgi:hypothetical protein
MDLRRRTVLGAGLASALGLLAGCTGDWEISGKKVLFIGNSFTDYNGGLDAMLNALAPRTRASRIAPGGRTLQQHAASHEVAKALSPGEWDVVVLQEQSQIPVMDPASFEAGASRLVAMVRAAKARPMLLATWGRPDSPGVTTEALEEAYYHLGGKLSAKVIPAGTAFASSQALRPGLVLHGSDGHPTTEGTYLAACTAFTVLYDTSPVGNSARAGLSEDVATHLQTMGKQAVPI